MDNSFEVKSTYDSLKDCANKIMTSGENIMNIFNGIDQTMKELYGENWQGVGADNAKDRYDEIRKNYEVFYQKIKDMKSTVDSVSDKYQSTESNVSKEIESV